MKKPVAALLALCALTFGTALSLAQAPPDPQARMAKLAQDLSLTEVQKPQFQQILDEERTNLGASMKQEREQKTDVQIAHQNHARIEAAAMAKLKPVLTDEQFKKYQGIVEAEATARHHREAAAAPVAPAP
jgi:Spy/CpxP family protein refolding chaperone